MRAWEPIKYEDNRKKYCKNLVSVFLSVNKLRIRQCKDKVGGLKRENVERTKKNNKSPFLKQ